MQTSQFPLELTDRLKDEALAIVCARALEKERQAVRSQAQAVEATRPPFAFLSSKQARETFESSMEGVRRTEQQIRERLQRVEHMRSWAGERVREQLDLYLLAASVDYRMFTTLPQLAQQWRRALHILAEHMLAFARDARALIERDESTPLPAPAGMRPLELLRRGVGDLVTAASRCVEIAGEFERGATGRLAAEIRMPTLPRLPDLGWLDRLVVKGLPAAVEELRLGAVAAREFCQIQKDQLLAQIPDVETACAAGKTAYLEHYWNQLREHTLRYHVTSREADELLADLEQRFRLVEQKRQQVLMTQSPFAFVR